MIYDGNKFPSSWYKKDNKMGTFKQEFNVSRSTSRTKQIIKNITPNDRGKKEWNPILIQQYPLKSQRILK